MSKNDKHFTTDHLRSDLGGRTARGGAVAITAQGVKFVVTLGATSVMARLLSPQDYGLIGMVTLVTGFIAVYKDLGLAAATIQRPEITGEQVSTLFWLNTALSVGLALLTAAIAPLVAWFYHEPKLTWITLISSAGFVISGLAVQHEALLRRQMRYFSLATVGLVSMFVGYTVGIYMAWRGFSYWALVVSQLAWVSSTTLLTVVLCGWVPGVPKKNSGVRSMIKFGGNLTGFATINFFARNLDNLLIGRVWGAYQLGIYNRAYQVMMLPIDQINEPITSVALPSLSRLVDDPDKYRRAYLRMLEKIALITMPGMAVMIATSDWIVQIMLGPQWREVGTLLVILGIVGLFQPISNSTGWLFVSQGRTHEMFKLSLISGPVTMASIVIGLPWGAKGVAISYVAAQMLVTNQLLYWTLGRKGPVRMIDFYRTVAPFAAASLCALAAALAFRHWQQVTNPFWGIIGCLDIALCTTVLALVVLPAGRNALRDSINSLLLVTRSRRGEYSFDAAE